MTVINAKVKVTGVDATSTAETNLQSEKTFIIENRLNTILWLYFQIAQKFIKFSKVTHCYLLHLLLNLSKNHQSLNFERIIKLMFCDLVYLANSKEESSKLLTTAKELAYDSSYVRLDNYAKDEAYQAALVTCAIMIDGRSMYESSLGTLILESYAGITQFAKAVENYCASHAADTDLAIERLASAMVELEKKGFIEDLDYVVTSLERHPFSYFFIDTPCEEVVQAKGNGPTYKIGDSLKIDKLAILLQYLDGHKYFTYRVKNELATYEWLSFEL